MDLRAVLKRVTTLSSERKEELIKRYEKGVLTEKDRSELQKHILESVVDVEDEMATAQTLLGSKKL